MRGNGSRRKWPYPSPALRPAPPSSAEGRRPTSRRPAGMPPTGMVNWYSWPWRSAPANASQGGSPRPLPLWPKQAIDRPTILARVTTFLMTSAPHNPPPRLRLTLAPGRVPLERGRPRPQPPAPLHRTDSGPSHPRSSTLPTATSSPVPGTRTLPTPTFPLPTGISRIGKVISCIPTRISTLATGISRLRMATFAHLKPSSSISKLSSSLQKVTSPLTKLISDSKLTFATPPTPLASPQTFLSLPYSAR